MLAKVMREKEGQGSLKDQASRSPQSRRRARKFETILDRKNLERG